MALISGFVSKVFWGTMRQESQRKRDTEAELSNDLVICLLPYIFTALINSFMYIYLLTDAVSSDTQLWTHPVTVSLLKDGTDWIQMLKKGVSAQVLDHYCHFYMMISLCFLPTEQILYQTHALYRPASQQRSQLSALKRQSSFIIYSSGKETLHCSMSASRFKADTF